MPSRIRFTRGARAYLIKHGIAFRELSTGHESFKAEVLPKGKLPTIPTLVTPKARLFVTALPSSSTLRRRQPPLSSPRAAPADISALFDVIGTDGLLRPAMHYRWNFPEDNLEFLRYHFFYSQRDTPKREEKTEQ